MRVGLAAAFANPWATPEYLVTLAKAAEERGFDSIWAPEHVVLFDEYASRYPYSADGRVPAGGEIGVLEPFASLAFMAAVTSTIRLGTGICLVPQRNPVYTAKEAASVDWLSNGRFDLGVGIGWLAEEYKALAVPFERRADRCREYIEVIRRLWCEEISSFDGEFYKLPACRQYPKPLQQPHPPIHFGGESDAALRRVAEMGQGWYGFNVAPEDVAGHVARLTRFLDERGRKREDVFISIRPYLLGLEDGMVKRYEDTGIDQLIVVAFGRDEERMVRALDSLAASVLQPLGR